MKFVRASIALIIAAVLFAAAAAVPAQANDAIKKFYGNYIGSGIAERLTEGTTEQRDLDVSIQPYKDKGFTLKWITVIRAADGGRATEGVKRREVEENFLPFQDKKLVFIDAPSGGLFSKAELPNPLKGEPLRWAAFKDDTLTVYSMAITDSGKSEQQIYHRTLTEKGIAITFMRMHDEKVLIRLTGELIRTK